MFENKYRRIPKKQPSVRHSLTLQVHPEFLSELNEFSEAIGINRHALMHLSLRKGIDALKAELAIPESDQSQN